MSLFDDNVDALGVVEDHAKAVFDLEEKEAAKILRVYGEVAGKLRARLRATPRDTFTAQQLRVTLVQLEGALRGLQQNLRDSVDLSAELMADKGVRDLVTEIGVFNDEFEGAVQPVNIDLVQTALDTKARLINQYQASIDAYSTSLRQRISDGLTNMVVERLGPEAIYQRMVGDDAIGSFFAGEAWRLRRIVRTELHGMYGTAKLNALDKVADDNPGMLKALYHPLDSRTGPDSVYLKGLNLHPKIQDPFVYTWKGHRRIFLAPPDRPNDRAILIPYHPSWI